jgi:hypothetical protein
MQEIAEDKKKAYKCLVWSEKAISEDMLFALESAASSKDGSDLDEDGRRCLQARLSFTKNLIQLDL